MTVTTAEVAESLATYLVGGYMDTALCTTFTAAELRGTLPKDEPARYFAAKAEAEMFGDIVDEIDWEWNGKPAVLFIVV